MGKSASIRSSRETTPVRGLTCLRNWATVAEFDRHRCATGVAQLLAAAGRALRTGRHVMLHNGHAQQVEADDVIAHVGTEVGSDCFCDLDGRKLNAALSDHIAGKR